MGNEMARLYDDDFYAWTQLQARELKRFAETRPNLALDLPHLAEEIRDLGKEQRNVVRSLVRQVLVHFLLLELSPAQEPRNSWIEEILAARAEIDDRLTETLKHDLKRRLPKLYEQARARAKLKLQQHDQTAEPAGHCPYTLTQVLDADWYPDRHSTDEPSR
jgi:hypothetical protein